MQTVYTSSPAIVRFKENPRPHRKYPLIHIQFRPSSNTDESIGRIFAHLDLLREHKQTAACAQDRGLLSPLGRDSFENGRLAIDTADRIKDGQKLGQSVITMYNAHRGMVPAPNSRLAELLDQVRAEFDSQQNRTGEYEQQSEFARFTCNCLSCHACIRAFVEPQ